MTLLVLSAWTQTNNTNQYNLDFLKQNLIPIYDSQWGSGLFIKEPAVPYAAYIFQDYPIQIGLNSRLKTSLGASSEVIQIKTIIHTNTLIKYRIKEKIVKIENRKRESIIGIICGIGGLILGILTGKLIFGM